MQTISAAACDVQVRTRGCGDGTRRRNGSRRQRPAVNSSRHRDVISYGTHNAPFVAKFRRMSSNFDDVRLFAATNKPSLYVFAYFVVHAAHRLIESLNVRVRQCMIVKMRHLCVINVETSCDGSRMSFSGSLLEPVEDATAKTPVDSPENNKDAQQRHRSLTLVRYRPAQRSVCQEVIGDACRARAFGKWWS